MTVSKSQFKPRAFEYFRLVQEQRETIVVTDRGMPVLKIVPFEGADAPDLAALRGTLVRYDEPLEPVGEDLLPGLAIDVGALFDSKE